MPRTVVYRAGGFTNCGIGYTKFSQEELAERRDRAMTENEALEALKLEGGLEITGRPIRVAQFFEGIEVAIKALEEVQQYRAIGTPEEFRAAVEKQTAKRALHQGCYDKNGEWHEWNGINGKPYELCPNCRANLCCETPLDIKPKYCPNCGQKLDWRNKE